MYLRTVHLSERLLYTKTYRKRIQFLFHQKMAKKVNIPRRNFSNIFTKIIDFNQLYRLNLTTLQTVYGVWFVLLFISVITSNNGVKKLAENCWHLNWIFPPLHSGTSGKYAKISDFWKIYRPISVGGVDYLFVNIPEIWIKIIRTWSQFKQL